MTNLMADLAYIKELYATGHFDELIAELSSKNVTFEDVRNACEEFIGEKNTCFSTALIRFIETKVIITLTMAE